MRCQASSNGSRCDLAAGHDGQHVAHTSEVWPSYIEPVRIVVRWSTPDQPGWWNT